MPACNGSGRLTRAWRGWDQSTIKEKSAHTNNDFECPGFSRQPESQGDSGVIGVGRDVGARVAAGTRICHRGGTGCPRWAGDLDSGLDPGHDRATMRQSHR
jgi:hypothetical protein